MRPSRSLAGQWSFQIDPEGELTTSQLQPDREITVPLPWGAAFPELVRYSGYAWYQRTVDLAEDWLTGELLLHFGAVDYWCQVFVNGQQVAEHEGGYTPFTIPIRQYVNAGQNTLTVRVYDSVQEAIRIPRWFDDHPDSATQPPFDPRLIPHGKQEWYLNVGGIWQDMTLTAVPAAYIQQVHITPNIHTGEVQVEVELRGENDHATLQVEVDGVSVSAPTTNGQTRYTLSLQMNNPNLWTPESPNLYTATITLTNGEAQDSIEQRFGFREIRTHHGQLLLNGEPIILLSALDQDFYPETIYTVPSDDYLRDEFRKAKELGLNSLRCHIKVPDPRYLDLADEMGLLIWEEIPSWRTFHPKTTVHPAALHLDDTVKNRVRQTLRDMIARDYNHPSLIAYSIVNEDWGTALLLSAADRAWLVEMVDLCKALDPTRLVVDNSPCPAPWGLSIHVKTDIEDFHIYTNIPDQADSFEQFVEQFALRPTWTFSADGLGQRSGHEALIMSEFGNWGMPLLRNIAPDGEAPWFDLGPWWSSWEGEPGYPQGVTERFKRLGLDVIWPDYDTFAEATQWHQFMALKFEIETMRRRPSIAGYVITELTDIYWESNGLLDFERCPKVYHDQFKTINAPDVVVPRLRQYAYWDDQVMRARLYVSHFGPGEWPKAQLRAMLGESQVEHEIPALKRGEVQTPGVSNWTLPRLQTAETLNLNLHVYDEAGNVLATNDVPIWVMPAAGRDAAFIPPVTVLFRPEHFHEDLPVDTPTPATEVPMESPVSTTLEATTPPTAATSVSSPVRVLRGLGYQVSTSLTDGTQLVISDHLTSEILEWVRKGGDLLFLSSGPNAFFWSHGRSGSYGGNWMTSFSWLRPGIHRRLPVSNPLTLPFIDVMPLYVILGLPVEDSAYQQDFLAGQVTGWLGHPALHTIQFRCGQGRVVMTTYRLKDRLAYHPVAVAMLNDLVDHLTSDACQPVLSAR